jgi:hypothetical protein
VPQLRIEQSPAADPTFLHPQAGIAIRRKLDSSYGWQCRPADKDKNRIDSQSGLATCHVGDRSIASCGTSQLFTLERIGATVMESST